jgi:hypothetical protein
MSEVKSFNELLNSPEWQLMQEQVKESRKTYENECDDYWENLSYEDKLKSFYSVVKRIHKGEIIDRGSYRYVLYDVFGFDMDAYSIGMDCNYMELHNSIMNEEEYEEYHKKLRNKDGSIQY